MRRYIDAYIRSLAEREGRALAPQNRQDLGTYLTWLLQACGYEIIVPAYRYSGNYRISNTGYEQAGVDLYAIREDADGPVFCRFLLKRGDVTKANFGSEGGVRGDLVRVHGRTDAEDLWILGHRGAVQQKGILARLRDALVPRRAPFPMRRETIVVHNGNFEVEQLGGQRDKFASQLEDVGAPLKWWEAETLVSMSIDVLERRSETGVDLFPLGVQPYVSMVLDLLRVPESIQASLLAARVEAALDYWFFLDTDGSDGRRQLEKPSQLMRACSEVALFAAMVERCARQRGSMPWCEVLVVIERVICRLADAISRAERTPKLSEPLGLVTDQYVSLCVEVADSLEAVGQIVDGMARLVEAETVDYPLRVWWLAGRLACGAELARDRGRDGDRQRIVDGLRRVDVAGRAGLICPITDDAIAELIVVSRVWIAEGAWERVHSWAFGIVNRMSERRAMGLPGPSIWHRATMPLRDNSAIELATVWIHGRSAFAASGFSDSGSTLLPVCVWLTARYGSWRESPWAPFGGQDNVPSVGAQTWNPPNDLWEQWYSVEHVYSGESRIYSHDEDLARFVSFFESVQKEFEPSPMESLGLVGIDSLASVVFRHPLPLRYLVSEVVGSLRAIGTSDSASH